MSKHRDESGSSLWVLPSLAIPLVIAAFAWTAHVSSEGREIAPNVTFAGLDVSRMDIDEVMATVADREAEVEETPVIIDIGERRLVLTAEEIGFDYLYEATVGDIIRARHADGPWKEFVSWVTTPLAPVHVADTYRLDEDVARARLTEADFVLDAPVEPGLTNDDASYVYALPGANGLGVDIDEVVAELEQADITDGTIEIVAGKAPIVIIGGPTKGLLGPLGHIFGTKVSGMIRHRPTAFFIAKLNKADMQVLAEMLGDGRIEPVIDRTFDLDDVVEAFRHQGTGHPQGKVVVRIGEA